MNIDEIISVKKRIKEQERAILGRYCLTLADLGFLRRIRQMRGVVDDERLKQLQVMYGFYREADATSRMDRDIVRDMAEDALGERAKKAKKERQNALRKLT
jgi:hypothetical protein